VGDEAEAPVASEVRQVYEEQRFGLPMNDALLGLADRIDIVDVRIFVTAVVIQRESGGNLAENLDNLSQVIRARFRFKRDVKTKTAHGRMTGIVVAAAPVIAGFMMWSINPAYMEPLFVEPAGRVMLVVGAVMMLFGYFVIRRLVDIKL
jgi:tight adherence protein B